MRTALVLALAIGPLSAAPVPKEHRKVDDKALIVGTWRPVRHDGRPENANTWFRFEAGGELRIWHRANVADPDRWTWTNLDPKATPKRVTLTHGAGSGYDCLYELTGDTLKIGFIMNKEKGLPGKVELHPSIQLYEMARAAK